MDKEAVLKILRAFKQILESKKIRINSLVLFGSYSRAEYREGSDIDVVVISRDFKDKGYWERIDILSDAIYELFAPIEAVAMTPEEWSREESMVVAYAKDGEVLYAS